MIKQKPHETRLQYLTRVLSHFMDETIAGEQTLDYDGTTCDGACLANDFASEIEMYGLIGLRISQEDSND